MLVGSTHSGALRVLTHCSQVLVLAGAPPQVHAGRFGTVRTWPERPSKSMLVGSAHSETQRVLTPCFLVPRHQRVHADTGLRQRRGKGGKTMAWTVDRAMSTATCTDAAAELSMYAAGIRTGDVAGRKRTTMGSDGEQTKFPMVPTMDSLTRIAMQVHKLERQREKIQRQLPQVPRAPCAVDTSRLIELHKRRRHDPRGIELMLIVATVPWRPCIRAGR